VEALKHTPASIGINAELLESLHTDVVGRCRKLIVACRINGQRQQGYRRAIIEFNASSPDQKLPLLALIYDVITRWSATFNMIDRYLLMKEVSCLLS
jgi:hypothetical protein